jgi:hypothetical protein
MRELKFRQAAIAYLHVGILYEGAVLALWRRGLLIDRGPPWISWIPPWGWMLIGAGIVGFVVWGLWKWQNVWLARAVWLVHSLRVPTLITGAFFPRPDQELGPAFYGAALLVVVVNLWMLARAAWDV